MFSLQSMVPIQRFSSLDEDVCMDPDDELDQEIQQGCLCVSTDPRRVGGPDGEPTIINIEELRSLLITQQSLEDQTVWLTTVQVGFPVDATALQVIHKWIGAGVKLNLSRSSDAD